MANTFEERSMPPYPPPTAQHVAAASEDLASLADLATVQRPPAGSNMLHVRLCHYENTYFLSPLLFGFSVLGASGRTAALSEVDFPDAVRKAVAEEWEAAGKGSDLETALAIEGAEIITPDAATAREPFSYALMSNLPVQRQLEGALRALASLLTRGVIARRAVEARDLRLLDQGIPQADEDAENLVGDAIRKFGWQAAAELIRERSAAQGLALRVTFSPALFGQEAVARRASLLRRVYNELPPVALAVDRVATRLSRGMTLVGSSSDQVLRQILDQMDVGAVRTFMAHVARDAFVCGNGCLQLGAAPSADLKLITPEELRLSAPATAVVAGREVPVMHIAGAKLPGSFYGASALEPFLSQVGRRDSHILMWYRARAYQLWDRGPSGSKDWGAAMVPFAARAVAEIDREILAALGTTTDSILNPPSDLYFQGFERMAPAPSILVSGGSD